MKMYKLLFLITAIPFTTFAQKKSADTTQVKSDTAQVKKLNEVAISGVKPLITRKVDRIVFNLENSIAASGGNVWDALTKVPSVQTKFDGGITAGNKSVVVYMDGKPLRLSGEDLATYLRSLPSDQIPKIELISNPPASFDADGGAVLQLISKKNKAEGLNITLNAAYTQAKYGSYNGSSIFNYRKGKVNIYGNYGYSRRKKYAGETEYIIYQTPSSYSRWDNIKDGAREANANSYRFGMDYDIDKNQVLGLLINGYNGTNSRGTTINTAIRNQQRSTPDSLLKTDNYSNGSTDQYTYNLNYKLKLDTSGGGLNIDLDYVPFHSPRYQSVNNQSLLSNGSLASAPYRISTTANQQIDIWSAKADYNWKTGKFNMESGIKYSGIKTSNSNKCFNNAGSIPILDVNRSDDFNYDENTSAAYASVNSTAGKWEYQLGLRAEYTRTTGNSLTLNSINKNNYLKIFPTLFIVYKAATEHEFTLNYGYRISRPDYGRLNPFRYYTSPYSYMVGNPGLQPAFIHSVELGYTYKRDYNFGLFYRSTNGYFSNITVQDNENKLFYDTQQNLDLSLTTGFSISATFRPAKWWEMNNYAQGTYKREKSGYLLGTYDYDVASIYINTNQVLNISNKVGLKAEISGWYSSKSIQGIYKLHSTFDVSAGIRQNIAKGKGTIRLAATDLFYGNPFRIDVNYLNQKNGFQERTDTRSVTLSLSWKLGNMIGAPRKRNTGAEDEKKRAGY
ncbi:MAG: TonB-dependent receptor [Pedobacter sp.]|nr:MAG: TonB-dependent receptor [Pedobacter sp.]